METKNKGGRPRGNKVHFQARVEPEMAEILKAYMLGGRVGACVSDEVIELKRQVSDFLEGAARDAETIKNLQSQVMELQAGLTDPYIRGLRALVSKQQLEIARLS